MTVSSEHPDHRSVEALPRSVTNGAILVIFLLNAMILGYAIHVSRPSHPAAHESTVPGRTANATGGVDGAVLVAATAPVVPGLHQEHPLTLRQVGDVLISALNCVGCHADDGGLRPVPKRAPDLTHVGTRVSSDYMRRFIADPSGTHAGTTMPDVLGEQPPEERTAIADAIVRFLVADAPVFRRSPLDDGEVATGQALFHRIGCVACHPPRDVRNREVATGDTITLSHAGDKYSRDALAEFLFDPLRVRPSGRMPGMNLTRSEAAAIGSYLVATSPRSGDGSAAGDMVAGTVERAAEGRRHFEEFNCTACHAFPGTASSRWAAPLSDLDPERGCLSTGPSAGPDFDLTRMQRRAIQAALVEPTTVLIERDRVNVMLTAFNCIACHERDGYGGVASERDEYFTTSEPSLGNEARIPPQLTLLGAKMRSDWIRKVLLDAETSRPYMHARMPQFGEPNVADLPDLVVRVDTVQPVDMPTPQGDAERALRSAGRSLVGEDGLNCIACHNFKGIASPGFQGMDLLVAFERLKPSWFHHFLRSPSAHRPGITMPTYWPDGVAVRDDILDGDTGEQIHAIWHYLSLGQSAADPPGIRPEPTRLDVTDTARTYRGRSRIAGFRGIAVGYPGGVNFAFNAQTGTMSGLWSGAFISVNWSGQGAGDFSPSARAIDLAQDVSFLRLANDAEAWPLRPRTNEENPVNPDPQYPRNRGYRFGGYYFDDASIPTFMYRAGTVAIEDRSTADTSGPHPVLSRTFTFSSSESQTIWFRALTGDVDRTSDWQFETTDVRVLIPQDPDVVALLREFGTEGAQELLLRLEILDGTTTLRIDYELLR